MDRNDCTRALWYQVPRDYLPDRYPTFLPSLLTLFNLLGTLILRSCDSPPRHPITESDIPTRSDRTGAPILFIWWFLRYSPRIYPYLHKWYNNYRAKKHNRDLIHVEPFRPYRLFRLATPYIHYTLLAWAVVAVSLTVGLFIDVAGETGLGVGLFVTGSGVFVAWRGIEWKWDDWVEAGRYRDRDVDVDMGRGKPEMKEVGRKEFAEV